MRKRITLIFFGVILLIFSSFAQSNDDHKDYINRILDQMADQIDEEKFRDAFELGQLALSTHNENIKKTDTLLGDIFNSLGNVCIDLGEFDNAKEYFDKCLELRLAHFDSTSIQVAMALFSLGLHSDYTNELENALEYYRRAATILKTFLPTSQANLSKTYFNMSICYALLEDYEKAIQYCIKALGSDLSIYGRNHIDVALDYNNLGILYEKIEENNKADIAYNECKKILIELGKDDGLDMARLVFNLGNLSWKRGDFETAMLYLKEVLDIQKRILPSNDRDMIECYWLIGVVNRLMGNSKESIRYLTIALNLAKSNSNIQWEIYQKIHYHFTKAHLANANLEKAQFYLNKAKKVTFPDPSKIATCTNGVKSKVWANLLVLEADLLVAHYEQDKEVEYLHKAQEKYKEALVLGQAKRATFKSEQSKESWLSKRYELFEKAITCQYLLHSESRDEIYLHQAFELAEQSKALLLLDALQKSKATRFSNIPDTLIQKEKELSGVIANLEQQIFESHAATGLDSQTIVLQGELFAWQQEYDSLLLTINKNHPRYFQLLHQRKTLCVTELQQDLDKDHAILQYFVGDSSLFTFFIDHDQVKLNRITLDFPLEEWVKEWRSIVEAYGSIPRKRDDEQRFVDLSLQLFDKLLAPFATQLPEALTVVTDGVLGYLPFEALLVSRPEHLGNYRSYDYLLYHHQLSYTFSNSWSKEIKERTPMRAGSGVLAMAPVFSGSPFASNDRFSKLNMLAFNQQEAEDVVSVWGGKSLTGLNATKPNFYKYAPDYQILHLATHAKANSESGAYSYLAFTEISDSIENEILYARELYEMSIAADLVILSACETGAGELQQGEGVISLARGFSYAGARSIVNTLWPVSDRKSAQLMTNFYKYLQQNFPKDKTLRQSKIDYIQSARDRDAHPFYWAAFVPLGDMAPLEIPTNALLWWSLVFAGLLVLGGLGIRYTLQRPLNI